MVGLLMGIPLGRITKKSTQKSRWRGRIIQKRIWAIAARLQKSHRNGGEQTSSNIKKRGREGGLTSASSHYSTPLGKANFSVVPLGYTTRNSNSIQSHDQHVREQIVVARATHVESQYILTQNVSIAATEVTQELQVLSGSPIVHRG